METSMRAELPNLPVRSGLASERHDQARFATCIRMARAALGWSQHDLARMVGMTQRSINRIELGRCEPRRTTILAIEALLRGAGIKIDYGCEDVSITVSIVPADAEGRVSN